MNEAPSRDPESIVKVCSGVMTWPSNSVSAVAATGDPESTT
jgi:hypothetical protein